MDPDPPTPSPQPNRQRGAMAAAILIGAVAVIAYQFAAGWGAALHNVPLEALLGLLFAVWLICGVVRSFAPRRPQQHNDADR